MSSNDENLIEQLRKFAILLRKSEKLPPQDIKKAQTLAADLYLKHSNRSITLSNDEFLEVVSILNFKAN